MLNQSKQDQELVSALFLYCICPEGPLPVPVRPFQNKTRNLSLLPAQTVSAKQGPLPGQVTVCRHRTVTPNPVFVYPESSMEASRSAGALIVDLSNTMIDHPTTMVHLPHTMV